MKTNTVLALILGAATLGVTSVSIAEDIAPTRGRLRDGTAYRTDTAGNKLSDYIAELEVTNAELRRQLTVAEEQAAGKPAAAAVPTLPSTTSSFSQTKCPVCPYTEASVTGAVKTAVANEKQICEHRLKSAAIEGSSTANLAASSAAANCEQQAEQRLTKTQRELDQRLTDTQRELNQQIAKLKDENQALSQQLMDTQDQLASVEKAAERGVQQRASLASAATVTAESSPIAASSGRAGSTNLKQAFASELATTQNLIMTRKSLLDTLRSKRPSISLSPQSLVAKDGTSLDSVRSQIASNSATTSEEKLARDLKEIQTVLKDDISVLSRLINN